MTRRVFIKIVALGFLEYVLYLKLNLHVIKLLPIIIFVSSKFFFIK